MTVEHVRVGDVLKLVRRPVVVDPLRDYEEIGIRSFGKGIFHKEPISGVALGNKRVFEIRPGELVLSNVFAWEGGIAVSSASDEGKIGSHRFMTYQPIDGKVDVVWAGWFFLSEAGMELIRKASPGSAGRNRTLAVERFEAIEIPLPPIDEQLRAAARLDRVHALTAKVSEGGKRGFLLSEALKVAISSLPLLAEPERAALGWRRLQLGDVMTLARDEVKVDPASSYANVGVLSFGRGLFSKPPIDGASTSAKTLYRVAAGQFIYSRLFAFEGAYAHVPEALDGRFVSQEFPTFDPDPDRLDGRWLASYLRSPDRWAELAVSSKGLGVRRQRVQTDAILRYGVWLPPIDQQLEMVKIVDRLDRVGARRAHRLTLTDAVLPAAMNRAFTPDS